MKNVFITGVLGGIGMALAKKFKSEGYYVYGIDKKQALDDPGDRFFQFDIDTFVRDVDYRIKFSEIFDKVVPSLNVLINNAATQLLDKTENIKIEDWQTSINVNLTGPLMLTKLFLSKLTASQGSIINIASIHHDQTKPGFVTYATTKSGLLGLTKAMAVDLGNKVRVNAISPAAIDTYMLREGFNHDLNAISKLSNLHPVNKIGKPYDVAEVAYFLADEKNDFINGANIKLDGGISSVLNDL